MDDLYLLMYMPLFQSQHDNTQRNKLIFRRPALRVEVMLMRLTSVGENPRNERARKRKRKWLARRTAQTGRKNVKPLK
jgi:hypothetical protein